VNRKEILMASCMKCDQPLPVGATFCAYCGAAQTKDAELGSRERELERREREIERRERAAPSQRTQASPTIVQNIYPARRKRRHPFLTLVALVVIIGAIGAAANSQNGSPSTKNSGAPATPVATAAPAYSVTESGSMLKVQQAGEIVTFATTVHNTGTTTIPHLVLWFQGIDPWVVDTQTSSCRTDEPASVPTLNFGSAWDYGQVAPGVSCTITITMAAKDAGSHHLSWNTYADLDSAGAASNSIDGASYEWTGVINP
jgi:hypothetical protein